MEIKKDSYIDVKSVHHMKCIADGFSSFNIDKIELMHAVGETRKHLDSSDLFSSYLSPYQMTNLVLCI